MAASDLTLVKRDEWKARYSAGRTPMPRPVRDIFIHHSVTLVSGPEGMDGDYDPTDDPCKDMRHIESVLNSRGLAPGYSFVVHPSGVVLEGAGGNKGAHTEGHNSTSYGICFMGDYTKHKPTLSALVAAARLINVLRYVGAVSNDFRVRGHRDTKATACPGGFLYDPVINGRSGIQWITWFAATNV